MDCRLLGVQRLVLRWLVEEEPSVESPIKVPEKSECNRAYTKSSEKQKRAQRRRSIAVQSLCNPTCDSKSCHREPKETGEVPSSISQIPAFEEREENPREPDQCRNNDKAQSDHVKLPGVGRQILRESIYCGSCHRYILSQNVIGMARRGQLPK